MMFHLTWGIMGEVYWILAYVELLYKIQNVVNLTLFAIRSIHCMDLTAGCFTHNPVDAVDDRQTPAPQVKADSSIVHIRPGTGAPPHAAVPQH